MTEPIDPLAALQRDALSDQYTNHVLLTGLDELRAHQRAQNVGKAVRAKAKPKPRRKAAPTPVPVDVPRKPHGGGRPSRITPELVAAVKAAEGSQAQIAKRFGIGATTVSKIQNGLKG